MTANPESDAPNSTCSNCSSNKPALGDIVLDSLFDGVYFVDTDRRITYWSAGADRISGYPREEVLGSYCYHNLLKHIDYEGRELCLCACPLQATMADGRHREANLFLHHKLGHRVPVAARTAPVRDNSGTIVGAVEIFCDNSTSYMMLEEFEKLKQEVFLDTLTQVGNRKYGEMNLGTRIYDLQTNDCTFGVLFMDIDHFKKFNDQYGHQTGDQVLVMVARSVSQALRKIDVVSRWGGEEFLVILPGATGATLRAVAERIRMLVEKSYLASGEANLQVTVSIGAALSRADDTLSTIVSRADALMYKSKNDGRNRVSFDQS